MSLIELESSLQPLSPDQPCGEDLQYDAQFVALQTASQGKPEQQYGDTIIPAEEPDWREVRRIGMELLKRTKDLRISCLLARAMADTQGIEGFRSCLALTRGYIEQFWDTVHPQLDPEDDNDPTERVNVISSLADRLTTVAQINRVPLVRSSMLGEFSMHDILVARGDLPHHGEDPPPATAAIEAAFQDCDLEGLRATEATVAESFEDAVAIEELVTTQVGAANAASLETLTKALKTMRDYLRGQIAHRDAQAGEGESVEAAATEGTAIGGGPAPAAAATAAGVSGEIRSREDVVRTLDRICQYYDKYEPSSPLPLLLKRAKRLVSKSFLDILEDMTPEGVSQARMIAGIDQGGEGE
jgi:type VI secretion system protein ImpA